MKVAITGASGFLGTAISKALIAGGHDVRALDLNPSKVPGVEYIPCSVFGSEMNSNAFDGIDSVIHLAWSSRPSTANYSFSIDAGANVAASLRIAELAVEKDVEHIIFASSGGTVYGRTNSLPIAETHRLRPINAYGAGKAAFEAYLGAFAKFNRIRHTILRISNPFGPGQFGNGPQGVIATAIWKMIEQSSLTIWGDGKTIRDYVYVDDVADAFLKTVEKRPDGVFNVGSNAGLSLLDIIEGVRELTGRALEVRFEPNRSIDVSYNVLNCDKANKILGWESTTPFQIGLSTHIDWAKETIRG